MKPYIEDNQNLSLKTQWQGGIKIWKSYKFFKFPTARLTHDFAFTNSDNIDQVL